MTTIQKKEALENTLHHFGFTEQFFIYSVNSGRNSKFAICQKNEVGGMNTKTIFMYYDEMNAFLRGYNQALTRPIF